MANSWFYGEPTLPEDIPWPVYKREGVDHPMSFVLQLDCADVPKLAEHSFPEKGVLLFFHEFDFQMERSANGAYDQAAKVIYLEDVANVPPRGMPPLPEVDLSEIEEGYGEYHYWEEGNIAYRYNPPKKIEPIIIGGFEAPAGFHLDPNVGRVFQNYTTNAVGEQGEILRDKLGIHKAWKWAQLRIFGKRSSYDVEDNNEYMTLLHLENNGEFAFFKSTASYYIKKSEIEESNFDNVLFLEGF